MIAAQKALRQFATAENKRINEWFFKTGPGQYGHGDQFIGVKSDPLGMVAREFRDLDFPSLRVLLLSPIHEDRSLALAILRPRYEKAVQAGDRVLQKKIFDFFWKHRARINNWDLVDGSAPYISGHFIFANPSVRKKVFGLISSRRLWDRRIAMISSYYFIRSGEFEPVVSLARALLRDEEDLMHKASGWMLREMGKRNLRPLRKFLERHAHEMPRTMLRYAIEKMGVMERKRWMGMKETRTQKK